MIRQKLINLTKDTVFFGTALVTVSTFVAGVFSYLLQFALGNKLSVGDYGVFNALLSLLNILGITSGVLSTSLIKISSELKAKGKIDTLTNLYWTLSKVGVGFFVIVLTFFSFLYKDIASYLNINDAMLLIYVSIILGLSLLITLPSAYLQGLLLFKAFSAFMLLGGVLRLFLPLFFVLLGYKIRGVFVGLTLTTVISYIVFTIVLKKDFIQKSFENLSKHYKKIIHFSLPVFFVTISMMLLNNIDIVLVKKYFDDTSTGYYSAAVTVSKILLFGTGAISVVMFPQVSQAFSKRENHIKLFYKFLGVQLTAVLFGLLFFIFFPHFIILRLFPANFINAVALIPKFSLFITLYVLINFLVLYFLAIEKTKVFLFQIPVVAIQFFLITLYHDSLTQIININLSIAGVLLVLLFIYFILNVRSTNYNDK